MNPDPSFERALRFEHNIRRSVAVETVPFRWGTAYFNPDFDKVWDLNFLAVETGEPAFSGDDLIAEAERLQGGAGLGHRRIAIDDGRLAANVLERFNDEGWMVNRFLFMALRRPPGREIAPARAQEIDRDQHREAYVRTSSESPYGSEPEVVRQLAGQTDLIAAHNDVRYFGASDEDGTLASVCVMFSDGLTAQVEDVATLRDYRGRGLATELLTLAIREANDGGHDLVFLVADEEDWPKELYHKLGFDPVGTSFDFVRPGDVVFTNDEG